jgi:hypothetical protein
VARSPKAFTGGLRHVSGGDWIVGATERRRNPRLAIPQVYHHVVRLWSRCRGGMGAGILPEPGGLNQQPAWLVRAFGILDGADAELSERKE